MESVDCYGEIRAKLSIRWYFQGAKEWIRIAKIASQRLLYTNFKINLCSSWVVYLIIAVVVDATLHTHKQLYSVCKGLIGDDWIKIGIETANRAVDDVDDEYLIPEEKQNKRSEESKKKKKKKKAGFLARCCASVAACSGVPLSFSFSLFFVAFNA